MIKKITLPIGCYIALFAVQWSAYQLSFFLDSIVGDSTLLWLFSVGYLCLIIGLLAIGKRLMIPSIQRFSFSFSHIWIGLGIGIVGLVLRGLAAAYFPPEATHNQDAITNIISYSAVFPTVLSFVCLGPIFEELVFRNLLIGYSFRFNKWIGVIASSALFSFAHGGYTPHTFLLYFIMGFTFSVSYAITDEITAPLTAHMMNNALAVYILLLTSS